MKVIVPTNNKGGVGKTKLSILLAEYFSKVKNYKVLAIDFDPQCNFSQRFLKMEVDPVAPEGRIPPLHPDYDPENIEEGDNWDGRSTIANIFYGEEVVPYPTYLENLDIAPGHAEKLLYAEQVRRSEVAEKVHKQLALFLSLPEVRSEYDIVIIDTAPSKGPLTVSAIKAATDIVIPCVMEEQPIQGIFGMLQLWMQESVSRNESNPLNLIGILPNMFRQTNLHNDMLDSLRADPSIAKYVLPVKLGQRTVFAEVDAEEAMPRTVFDLPNSKVAKIEALDVCQFIEKKVFKYDEKETIHNIEIADARA